MTVTETMFWLSVFVPLWGGVAWLAATVIERGRWRR